MDIENECTGFSAQWCPRCGTCRGCNRELHEYSEACPLHGAQSKHAEDPEADPRADYAPRATPPTPAEVRAVARLWNKRSVWDAAPLVIIENVRPHCVGPTPSLLWFAVIGDNVVVMDNDGTSQPSEHMVDGEDAEFVWFALSPDGGPVAWSQLARLVAEGGGA